MKRFLSAILFVGLFAAAAVACDCPGGNDTAKFAFGSPTLVSGGGGAGSIYSVPLEVSTQETTTFTQLTLEFKSDKVAYVVDSAVVGSDVSGTTSITEFPDTELVTFQVIGQLSGCDKQIAVAQFEKLTSAAGALEWVDIEGGPNSYCHVNYQIHHGLDGKITPTDICFDDGATGKVRRTASLPSTWTATKTLYR